MKGKVYTAINTIHTFFQLYLFLLFSSILAFRHPCVSLLSVHGCFPPPSCHLFLSHTQKHAVGWRSRDSCQFLQDSSSNFFLRMIGQFLIYHCCYFCRLSQKNSGLIFVLNFRFRACLFCIHCFNLIHVFSFVIFCKCVLLLWFL